MAAMMAELRGRYEVILVDSPPLGAGIDPFVLGTLSGNLMLVLRAGETDREMAESRLKILDRLPIRLLGAVLNDVRATGGVYKHYSYLSGYAAEEESDFQRETDAPPAVPSTTSG
jgi:Mrp family chromosome partitioning ATPase